MSREILLVVGSTELDKGDEKLVEHLTQQLGYDAEVIAGRNMLNHHLLNKELVVLSSTAAKYGDAANVIAILKEAPIPVVVLGTKLLKGMRMATESFTKTEQINYNIIIGGGHHPLTAQLEKEATISKAKRELFLVKPYKSYHEIATLKLDDQQKAVLSDNRQNPEEIRSVCLYAYEAGDTMFIEGKNKEKINCKEAEEQLRRKEAIEITAPARRVGYVFDSRTAAEATDDGWVLFHAAVRWAISLKTPDEILAEEINEIKTRREEVRGDNGEIIREGIYKEGESGIQNGRPPDNLVGLAFSGGGIRSATFSLGLLQGFSKNGFLRIFDYLSTVSGGGYVGGWWSAWLSRQDTKGIFPSEEKLEPHRADRYLGHRANNRQPEGSRCADDHDPIHHLRLFSNYLTPRKGALSTDTWGGIVYVSRNLLLTWLSLLPILFSFILLGQFYFLLQKDSPDNYLYPFRATILDFERKLNDLDEQSDAEIKREIPSLTDEQIKGKKNDKENTRQLLKDKLQDTQAQYEAVLIHRARSALYVLLPIVGWIILMSIAWMRSNVTKRPFLDWLAHTFASLVLILLFFCILCLIDNRWQFSFKIFTEWLHPVGLAIWAVIGLVLYLATIPWGVKELEWRKEIRKNKVSQVHTALLILLVMSTFFLALSAYGYDFANYIWFDSLTQGSVAAYAAKAGGWFTLIVSIAGSIFTAIQSAPSGGEDKNQANTLTNKSRFILLITPPLVLITFTVLLSWLARRCIYSLTKTFQANYKGFEEYRQILIDNVISHDNHFMIAVAASIILGFFFAIYELKKWNGWVKPLLCFLFLLGVCGLSGWLVTFAPYDETMHDLSSWKWHWIILFTVAFSVGAILCFRLFLFGKQRLKQLNDLPILRQILIAFSIALAIAVILAFLSYGMIDWIIERSINKAVQKPLEVNWIRDSLSIAGIPYVNWTRISLSIAGILFCGIAVFLEMLLSMKNTGRSMLLMAGSYIILVAFLLSSFFSSPQFHIEISLAYLTLALLTTSMGWTVALGWMSDPNWLSIHSFYRDRLVRGYLGASNPNRKEQEIYQSAIGDDVLMYSLTNCQKGAPYHLVNTTLNLVGAKDLATAQRSSSYFVLSKLYCGSLRTGYRNTKEYMDGRFSLGTAVAVSGAAISPNMGAKTQTAALSMLMTLLNVRLGFWSPTPSKGSWRSSNPRLWPFYTLREFLSQTNDLGSYCYLTDGGHFDNTGLYSLVERGCRFIIVSDNGADPLPCFEDLGDAIRRCRIDFGAEIELDISPFFKKKDETSGDQMAQTHYVVGTIKYSEAHLYKLGWKQEEVNNICEGVIILIKPSLLADEKADLRQYARQNREFPQQSTSDQWFDEAQFESYRRLGEQCAEKVLDELGLAAMLSTPINDPSTSEKTDPLTSEKFDPLTPKKIECAFNIARKTYEEDIDEVRKELPDLRQAKFKEKFEQCINPKPEVGKKLPPQTFDNDLV